MFDVDLSEEIKEADYVNVPACTVDKVAAPPGTTVYLYLCILFVFFAM